MVGAGPASAGGKESLCFWKESEFSSQPCISCPIDKKVRSHHEGEHEGHEGFGYLYFELRALRDLRVKGFFPWLRRTPLRAAQVKKAHESPRCREWSRRALLS